MNNLSAYIRNNLSNVRYITLLIILTLCFIQCGQPVKKYRVGIMCGLGFFANTIDGFKQKMSELGYVEEKNIYYDIQRAESNVDSVEIITKKFVSDKVDLIFVFPTDATLKTKEVARGSSIPILFANANIEGVNLVKSIKEPGENITGVRYPGPDLTIKRFEIMCEIAPKAKTFFIPYKRNNPIVPSQLEVLRIAANDAGIKLIEAPASSVEELRENLKKQVVNNKTNIHAILMIAEPLAVMPPYFLELAKYAVKYKIPFGGALMMVEGYSSIFGVSTDNVAVGKQAAPLADKILKGARAGTIPVVSAENFLQINLVAVKQLGIKIPEGILKQANKVINILE